MNILDKIASSFEDQLPFVVYRKPESTTVLGYFLENDDLIFTSTFEEIGFVFSPFDDITKTVLFKEDKAEIIEEVLFLDDKLETTSISFQNDGASTSHQKIVKKAIDKTNTSEIKKIVISRKETVDLQQFDLVKIYKNLLKKYKNAFVYAWFHPKVGLWLGATPETFVKVIGSNFKTMSLAGTQPFEVDKDPIWTQKEFEEQQLVTDFIEKELGELSSTLTIENRKTVRAGNLWHLQTEINGVLKEEKNLKSLIQKLHPTPAVCGLPRNEAKAFILENENYYREFYTGFLGEINLKNEDDKTSSLYVNLRCMKIENNTASIFVGGGITKDSNPQQEFLETVAKSNTMKNIL